MALNLNAIGKKIGSVTSEYEWKDLILYALGVGAGYDELEYVYEEKLKVIPSFAVTAAYDFMPEFVAATGVNLAGLLHGEHELIFHNPIPPGGGTLTSEAQITDIHDKGEGKGALVIGKIDTYHSDGQKLFTNVATLFSRLDGGFGGKSAPKTDFGFPDRAPDFEEMAHPTASQPLTPAVTISIWIGIQAAIRLAAMATTTKIPLRSAGRVRAATLAQRTIST